MPRKFWLLATLFLFSSSLLAQTPAAGHLTPSGQCDAAAYALNSVTGGVQEAEAAGCGLIGIPSTSAYTARPCPFTNPGSVRAGVGCFNWVNPGLQLWDYRHGNERTYFNPQATFPNFYMGEFLRSVFTQPNTTGAHQGSLYNHAYYLSGGINICQYGYCKLPWQAAQETFAVSDTPGNTFGQVIWGTKHSPGDMVGLYITMPNNTAGRNAGGAEGVEALSALVQQATVEYAGTVESVSGNQARITVSQGEGLQTSGEWLVNTSGNNYSTGSISSFNSNSGTAPATVSFTSGRAFPASSVNTALGTAVSAPGTTTVTPASMSGIAKGMFLAITDPKTFEIVQVTATTGSSFTATFAWPHQTTALVSGGGLEGYCFDPHGDDATHTAYSQVTGTLHYILPIVRSTSSTVDLWIANGSQGYTGYSGHAPAAGATYDIWPCARVVSVADPVQTAEKSDTLTLEPSGTMSLAAGNSVFLAHYFDNWTSGGQVTVQGFFPRLAGGQPGFFGNYFYDGMADRNWNGMSFGNNTPSAISALVGYPGLFDIWQGWGAIFHFRYTPHYAFISDLNDSTDTLQLLAKASSAGIGRVDADPVNHWLHLWSPSGRGTHDLTLDWISGGITSGPVNATSVTTPNLTASGGTATLSAVTTNNLTVNGACTGCTKGAALVISSGSSKLTNSVVGSGACGATLTAAAAGTRMTDVIKWSYASVPSAADGLLILSPYVATDHVNFVLCNPTAKNLLPSGLAINWEVLR